MPQVDYLVKNDPDIDKVVEGGIKLADVDKGAQIVTKIVNWMIFVLLQALRERDK